MRPIWVAAEYTGRSERTIRSWRRDGKLRSETHARTGEVLVDLVQAAELDAATPRRFRRLLKAPPAEEETRATG